MKTIIPSRFYLIKAFYYWLIDYKFTPYVLVNTKIKGVIVPNSFINDNNEIILDLSNQATSNLCFKNYSVIEFEATFNKVLFFVKIPCASIIELYSKENQDDSIYFCKYTGNLYLNESNKHYERSNIEKFDNSNNNIINLFK